MDFFSITRTELTTPVGQAIDKATNELLIGPDWSANMEICDMINTSGENAQNAVRAFKRKLRSDNPKVIQLTLTVIEAAVKNTNYQFHLLMGTRDSLNDIVALTDGKKGWEVREQALGLIQQWGLAFQAKQDTLPYFYEVYMKLRLKGMQFPPMETSSPIFTPPAHSFVYTRTSGHAEEGVAQGTETSERDAEEFEAELKKLEQDLGVVEERIKLCREMLPNSVGIKEDEALSEVIGFLEACKPRLNEVIEAGMQKELNESLLELALKVNVELQRTLDAEKNGTPLPVEDGLVASQGAAHSASSGGGKTDDLLDFDAPDTSTPAETGRGPGTSFFEDEEGLPLRTNRVGARTEAAQSGSKPATGDNLFSDPSSTRQGLKDSSQDSTSDSTGFPAPSNIQSAAGQQRGDDSLLGSGITDDFDAFLSERVSSGKR